MSEQQPKHVLGNGGEMARIKLIQLDGSLPNLALMKLSHWHRSQGDEVYRSPSILPRLGEGEFDRVYGSVIFKFSSYAVQQFKTQYPEGILGGTGSFNLDTVEGITGPHEKYSYEDYPDFDASIGFTQRGCRLSCKFCVVPTKEGKPKSVNAISDIWRGDPWPRHLHLLDNDFFGQSQWRDRIAEIRNGKFKVCLSQGINVRMITEESAQALASINYRDGKFKQKRLYTAWDNLRDEEVFFTGIDLLERAGISPKHVMAYMLIGFDIQETWEKIWHRFNRMVERGISPYPMVYDKKRTDLACFQRWVISGLYRFVSWGDYVRNTKTVESVNAWMRRSPGPTEQQERR